MSRATTIRQTLRLDESIGLEVITVEANGDCLYMCVMTLLGRQNLLNDSSAKVNVPPLLRASTSQSLRDYVANKLTQEQFDLYKMYAAAGLDEYRFINRDVSEACAQEKAERLVWFRARTVVSGSRCQCHEITALVHRFSKRQCFLSIAASFGSIAQGKPAVFF
mmetsp:Transcript_26097/g.58823  ORF Transcript_26097/g.58823 Transcript_26097/m.58823 type:complete len:164 (+) Transcript_26097:189-680(+)